MSMPHAPERTGPYLTRDGRIAIIDKVNRRPVPNPAVGSVTVTRRYGYIVGQPGRRVQWKQSGQVAGNKEHSGRDLVAWLGYLHQYVDL
jgi:hypothetical protein